VSDQPTIDHEVLQRARHDFRSLLLANPNYFGTAPETKLTPVFPLAGDRTYEELTCIGYQPDFGRLDAVVHVKQHSGYGGALCSPGTTEWIRFFMSFDDGATWQDQGVTSFTVHGEPGPRPLSYDVTKYVHLAERLCTWPVLPRVRAILSWNVMPTPGDPDYPVVWGNVLEARIQVKPAQLILLSTLLEEAKLELPTALLGEVDVTQEVKAATATALAPTELARLYSEAVPPHRFLQSHIASLIASPLAGSTALTDLGVDPAELIKNFLATDGDTSFEELTCMGLNTAPTQMALVGVVNVKRPTGYSGGLCNSGSPEYVAFWMDFGAGWQHIGTASVTVHDIVGVGPEGLSYSVFVPVELSAHKRPCQEGPVIARVRAILSWDAAPPATNPDFMPPWGNRLETSVALTPGPRVGPGEQRPVLVAVGDVGINHIDASGKAQNTTTIQTGLRLNDSPFAGRVTIAGYVTNATAGLMYRVMRKPHGSPDVQYAPVRNEPGGLALHVSAGGPPFDLTIHANSAGWYPLENYPNHVVLDQVMAEWYAGPADDGFAYDLRLELSTDGGVSIAAVSDVTTVLIDERSPDATLSINLAVGVQCADFAPGTAFTGRLTASDANFGSFSWEVEPSGPPNFPDHGHQPSPAGGSSMFFGGAIADPGVTNLPFTMDTGTPAPPMDPCGYALILRVHDRTNVNSGADYHWAKASVGFCLQTPQPH
jgi:hypothetical protein